MKKTMALILIFSILALPLMADPIQYEYEPYTEEEFPIWAHELRRAESIFFGSLAITFPLSMGAYALVTSLGVQGPSEPYQQALIQLGVAAGVSLIIALTDWIIGAVG